MTQKQKKFISVVWTFYKANGRNNLPWRKTNNSYHILVSEVMLQQTQVERVIPKYKVFLKKFPTIQSLAQAPLREVLILWQGLGYNRRAKMLHECAKVVVKEYDGTLPKNYSKLCQLPGIGPYTASAIRAFAYNEPVSMIETNIRTVFHNYFFANKINVSDKEILKIIEKFKGINNQRQWYWALMDYGSFLKKEYGSINNKSKHYKKQSKFEGSDRQIRGAILRVLSQNNALITTEDLKKQLDNFDTKRIDIQLQKLLKENLIKSHKDGYQLGN